MIDTACYVDTKYCMKYTRLCFHIIDIPVFSVNVLKHNRIDYENINNVK